jgi:hypothetical protein
VRGKYGINENLDQIEAEANPSLKRVVFEVTKRDDYLRRVKLVRSKMEVSDDERLESTKIQ